MTALRRAAATFALACIVLGHVPAIASAAAAGPAAAPDLADSLLGLRDFRDLRQALSEQGFPAPPPAPTRCLSREPRLGPAPGDQRRPAPPLPAIGEWMLDKNGNIAHFLGQRLRGLVLDEPINVIVWVAASTRENATRRLVEAAKSAGFPPRVGHSDGARRR